VADAIMCLKPKMSRGVDEIHASHIKNGSPVLLENLTLLLQMTFAKGIVPSTFCVGDLSPIPKKRKTTNQCSSFRPITVSTSLCMLYELLFIKELEEKWCMPLHQFGFQHDIGCVDALVVVANSLLDASCIGSSLALVSHDVRHVFNSLIHPFMLIRAVKRGVNPAILRPQRDRYAKLRVHLKMPQAK